MADITHPYTQTGNVPGTEAPVHETFDVDGMNVRKEYFNEPIAPAKGSVTLSAPKNENTGCDDTCENKEEEKKPFITRLDKLALIGAGANAVFNFAVTVGARAAFKMQALASGQPMLGGELGASAVSVGVAILSSALLAAIYRRHEKLNGLQTAGAFALFMTAGMGGGALAMNSSIVNFNGIIPFGGDFVFPSFNEKMNPVRAVESLVNNFRVALHI